MSFFIVFFLIPIASAELIFVTVVHRHGDRTPLVIYPTDPYQESYWKKGLGALTNEGKNRMYDLGKFMRNRYSGFLPVEYRDADVHVVSSKQSRTLMSGYCALASLYEPSGDDIWSSTVKNWQPIPIYILDTFSDNIISGNKKCPKYDQLIETIFENEISDDKKQKYGEVLKNLSSHTGLDLKVNLNDLYTAYYVYDSLMIEKSANLTLPDWTADFFQPLLEISKFRLFDIPYYNKETKKLRGGPLLKEIIENFDKKINGTITKKWWQYSAHDNTMSNILISLNVFDGVWSDYASAVFLELHKSSDNDYSVAVVYKNDKENVQNLTVPGCTFYCPLQKLKELVQDVIPQDWDEDCKLE